MGTTKGHIGRFLATEGHNPEETEFGYRNFVIFDFINL